MSFHFKPPHFYEIGEKNERHASWLELFFDLVFVVAITQLSDRLSHHLNLKGIWQFIALFLPLTWAWMAHTVFASRFDIDDIAHRAMTFVMMFAAAIMTVQIPTALEQGANGFAIGYLLSQLTLLFLYVRVLHHVPAVRHMTLLYLTGFGLGTCCWGISIFCPPPLKFWLWAVGLAITLLTPWVGKEKILSKFPLDISHTPERLGLFTIIVLGECVAAVILGLTYTSWDLRAITASIMAFILATLIWLQYYSYMQAADYKCRLSSGQPYIYLHLPLVISLVFISVSVEHMIIRAAVLGVSLARISRLDPVNIIFCTGASIWLASFFAIQYFTIRRYNTKLIGLFYGTGIGLIVILGTVRAILPVLLIGSINIIFSVLISLEFYFRDKAYQQPNLSIKRHPLRHRIRHPIRHPKPHAK